MPKPPYTGFTALNRRRVRLIHQYHLNKESPAEIPMTDTERRELVMLTTVVDAMMDFGYPDEWMSDKAFRKAVMVAGTEGGPSA